MRKINEIIIHCSATEAGHDFTAHDIDLWHRQRGFNQIGYHYVIRLDGTIEQGRPEELVGAHCLGHNAHSIGVCYIGGLRRVGNTELRNSGNSKLVPADTRTIKQKTALKILIERLKKKYPDAKVIGHRDTGAKKACPCFDAIPEYAMYILAFTLMFLLSSCRSPKTMTTSQATSDSVKLRVRDSTSQRFEFTFDSLELWGNPVIVARRFRQKEFSNLENKEPGNSQPQTLSKFLSSSVSKFHHAVIYGGKLSSNSIRSVSHDSIRNKSSSLAQHSVVPCYRSSVIPYAIAIAIGIALFFFYKTQSKVLSS